MFCPNCGTNLPEADDRFCPNCGMDVQATVVEQKRAPQPVKKNGFILPLVLLVVLLIVIFIGVIVVCLVLLPTLQEDENTPQENAAVTTTLVEEVTTTAPTEPTTTTTLPTEPPTTLRPGAVDPTYLIPGSDSRYLTQSEVDAMTTEWLIYSINEIYARKGYIFNDSDFANYFMSKTWYTPSVPSSQFSASMFNEYEQYNVNLLKAERKTRG